MSRRLTAALLVAAALLAGCTTTRTGGPAEPSDAPVDTVSSVPAGEGSETGEAGEAGGCEYVEKPAEPAPAGLPPDQDTDATTVTFQTSQGDLPIALADDVPCTVRSFVHLAENGFYNGTKCHRLTAAAGLKVLQCGDPKGDGTGGPGYTVPDELPTDLPPAPGGNGQELVTYPKGTVAMANAGPDTGGSQFFFVYGDCTLPPDYTVFGTIGATGLTVLDKIAKGGITAVNSPEDGTPKLPVNVESVTVS
jgi:peptidyl-prolyl cis-trans isomerase B (cyclophilin B)